MRSADAPVADVAEARPRPLLWVARIVALLVLVATLGGGVLIVLVSGTGHGSVRFPPYVLLLATLSAGLPMLMWWPDGGAGSRSRTLHAVGGLGLLMALVSAVGLLVPQYITPHLTASSIQRSLRHVTLIDARVEPLRAAQSVVGHRLTVRFRLDAKIPAGLPSHQAWEAFTFATLVPLDDVDSAGRAFTEAESHTRLERPGGLAHRDEFLPGEYTLTKELWMPYVNRPGNAQAPCRERRDLYAGDWAATIVARRAETWIVRMRAFPPASERDRKLIWEVRSEPIPLSYDGARWLEQLDSLPLPACDAR